MTKNIILDALIPRDDFEVNDKKAETTGNIAPIGVRDLERNSFFFTAFNSLRVSSLKIASIFLVFDKISDFSVCIVNFGNVTSKLLKF